MENKKIANAGKLGDKVKSDCHVEIELTDSGGVKFNVKSKVESMFGKNIRKQLEELANFFELKNAVISLTDAGALPHVISARFEAALKKLHPDEKKEFLPPMSEMNKYGTKIDRLRRSRLYLPGNEPKFYANAGLHQPDGVILDLEDSVSPTEKDAARYIVRNTLLTTNFYGAERMVRINQLPRGLDDLDFVIPHNLHVILIPKCESAEDVKKVEEKTLQIKKEKGITGETYFMPIIESALGVIKAYEIATASKYNCALAVGLEDYTADIGTQRTNEGTESFFARSMVIIAAKAAGIQPIDTVFSDVADMDALRESVLEAKSLGFEGKGCIHPRQIQVIHEAFAPTDAEITKAKRIVLAFDEAEKKGIGVVSIGSKMIDAPVVKRAQRVIHLALLNNLLNENWKEEGA